MRQYFSSFFLLAFLASFLMACEQEVYEKGDGAYSLLRADFVEAHVQADKTVDYFITDEGDRLNVATPFTPSWVETPDTFYRAACSYNNTGQTVEVISMGQISVIDSIIPAGKLENGVKTDPLSLESIWVSTNKRYLNIGLLLKIGTTDNAKAIHRVGLVADTVITHDDGKRTMHARLYHDQGDVPEYYSHRTYFSVLQSCLDADSISLTTNTYDGKVVKRLFLK